MRPGATLLVLPGTRVRFAAGSGESGEFRSRLLVNGTLVAQGTAREPIVFTSAAAEPRAGDWGRDRPGQLPREDEPALPRARGVCRRGPHGAPRVAPGGGGRLPGQRHRDPRAPGVPGVALPVGGLGQPHGDGVPPEHLVPRAGLPDHRQCRGRHRLRPQQLAEDPPVPDRRQRPARRGLRPGLLAPHRGEHDPRPRARDLPRAAVAAGDLPERDHRERHGNLGREARVPERRRQPHQRQRRRDLLQLLRLHADQQQRHPRQRAVRARRRRQHVDPHGKADPLPPHGRVLLREAAGGRGAAREEPQVPAAAAGGGGGRRRARELVGAGGRGGDGTARRRGERRGHRGLRATSPTRSTRTRPTRGTAWRSPPGRNRR